MTKFLLYPALIMSFGFGTYFGYSSRPTVEMVWNGYQVVKSATLSGLDKGN